MRSSKFLLSLMTFISVLTLAEMPGFCQDCEAAPIQTKTEVFKILIAPDPERVEAFSKDADLPKADVEVFLKTEAIDELKFNLCLLGVVWTCDENSNRFPIVELTPEQVKGVASISSFVTFNKLDTLPAPIKLHKNDLRGDMAEFEKLTYTQAVELVKRKGKTYRVASIDGSFFMLTADHNSNRINFEIVGGLIIRAYRG